MGDSEYSIWILFAFATRRSRSKTLSPSSRGTVTGFRIQPSSGTSSVLSGSSQSM